MFRPLRVPTWNMNFPCRLPPSLSTGDVTVCGRPKAYGVARVVARRASVVEVPLKRSEGLKGLFTRDQSERYDAVIDMMMEIWDEFWEGSGDGESKAKRSRSVSENISLIEREKVCSK